MWRMLIQRNVSIFSSLYSQEVKGRKLLLDTKLNQHLWMGRRWFDDTLEILK